MKSKMSANNESFFSQSSMKSRMATALANTFNSRLVIEQAMDRNDITEETKNNSATGNIESEI